jgi:small conductance mechanosensitive channel
LAQPSSSGTGPYGRRVGWTVAVLLVLAAAAFRLPSLLPAPFYHRHRELVDAALALGWALAAGLAVAAGRRELALLRDHRPLGERRRWNLVLNVYASLGYAYVLLVALGLLRLNLASILVGGAVTGIVLGIAAQSALVSVFGGMLVLLLRPYSVGDRVILRSPGFAGVEYTGTVREITLFYTTLDAATGPVVIPNSLTVSAVVRLEGTGEEESLLLAVPYRIPFHRVEQALASVGARLLPQVESTTETAYTVRARFPVGQGPQVVEALGHLLEDSPSVPEDSHG